MRTLHFWEGYHFVFCNANGNPIDPDNMSHREFHPALVRAGLRKIRFHDLRHTYTTLLIAQDANAKFIQAQVREHLGQPLYTRIYELGFYGNARNLKTNLG